MKNLSRENMYQEISERLVKEISCPLCSMVMDYEFNLLARTQYQVTNDDSVRNEISLEGGFCDFHFRQFKKIASGKTNIILLKSIIENGLYKKNQFEIDCRICKTVNEYENELIKNFLNFLSEQENRNQFEKTNGICSVHLKELCKLTDDETSNWLLSTYVLQIDRMQEDFENMNNFKSYYEIDREKRKLINVLIEKLAGRRTQGL
jgi:hypothetical protein